MFYSQTTTNEIVDQVLMGTDQDIVLMRDKIELMWASCLSQRLRRTQATDDLPGFTLAGDNVGMFGAIGESSLIT